MLRKLQAHNVSFNEVEVGLRHFCHLGAPSGQRPRCYHSLTDGYPFTVSQTFAPLVGDEDEFGAIKWERWQIPCESH